MRSTAESLSYVVGRQLQFLFGISGVEGGFLVLPTRDRFFYSDGNGRLSVVIQVVCQVPTRFNEAISLSVEMEAGLV